MKRRAWERLQTVLAVLLTLSLTGLTFAFWLLDAPIQWDSAGPAAAAARALGLITPPPATVDIPRDLQYGEAARPVRVVWSENGQRSAVQLDTALTDSAYDRLKDSLGQALGSAKTAARRTFDDWEHALSSDSLYLEYASALPLRSLALWLSSENTALPDLSARRLALVAADGSIALWFLDARDNTPYMCPTALPARDIPGVVPSGALPCRFGYEDAAFPRAPMVLLFERTPSPPEASCTPVSLSPPDTDAFLRALHINPDTNERYSIEEETTYLDDKRACRFSPDGTIHYTAPAATNRPASPLASPRLAEEFRWLAGDANKPLYEIPFDSHDIRQATQYKAAVITINDKGFANKIKQILDPES